MSWAACADRVRAGDPDRWRTAMLAPEPARGRLMALYAFLLEVARAPWIVSEPMLGEIRLQWWADALAEIAAGAPPRRHDVVVPLAETIREVGLDVAPLVAVVAARRRDLQPAPLPDRPALEAYLQATAGGPMVVAGRVLGAGDGAAQALADLGWGAGAAGLILALPELAARGRGGLPADTDISALARLGAERRRAARRAAASVPAAALPACLAGWWADDVLARAARAGGVPVSRPSEFRRRLVLLRRAFSGRW